MVKLSDFFSLENSAFINATLENNLATLTIRKLLGPYELTVQNLTLKPSIHFGPFLTLQELLESHFCHPWYCVFTPICL